jgi:hypothetical protein
MNGIRDQIDHSEDAMISQNRSGPKAAYWRRSIAVALSCLWLATGGALSAGAAGTSGKIFPSPEQAADALSAAWHGGATADLLAIFGPAGEKLVISGDPVADSRAHAKLASSYDEQHRIEADGASKAVLVLGKDDWPYPIPLVKQGAGWRFDVKSGAEQILDRRIGRNELNAIDVCRAYVEAQRDFAAKNGLHEYAQKVASTEGKHDGLYWQAADNSEESPFGPLVAAAEARGYGVTNVEGLEPFRGYYFRILTQQGENVPGGAQSYIVNGHMTGGFALVAFPAKYGDSGVMTFVVSQDGIVFEKNLGPDTAKIARRTEAYNPDQSWKVVAP